MADSVVRQVAGLKNLSHDELKDMYQLLHGREAPAYNRNFLMKRLAYRIQEIAYGGVSERTHAKLDRVLEENGFDENAMPRRCPSGRTKLPKDAPILGCTFVREWKGRRHEVNALRDGFEWEGRKYRSLTAVAKAITGTHWNGRAFFGVSSGRKS